MSKKSTAPETTPKVANVSQAGILRALAKHLADRASHFTPQSNKTGNFTVQVLPMTEVTDAQGKTTRQAMRAAQVWGLITDAVGALQKEGFNVSLDNVAVSGGREGRVFWSIYVNQPGYDPEAQRAAGQLARQMASIPAELRAQIEAQIAAAVDGGEAEADDEIVDVEL